MMLIVAYSVTPELKTLGLAGHVDCSHRGAARFNATLRWHVTDVFAVEPIIAKLIFQNGGGG